MSKLYTLRNELTGEASVLNGEIFKVIIDNTGVAIFRIVNYNNPKDIWVTSSIVSKEVTSDGILFETKSGIIYDLIDVATLIPTNENNVKAVVKNNENDSTAVKTTPAALSCYTADEIRNMKVEKYLSTDWRFNPDCIYGFSTIRDLEQMLKSGVDDYRLAESAKMILEYAGFQVTKIENAKETVVHSLLTAPGLNAYEVNFKGFRLNNTKSVRPIGYNFSHIPANYCDSHNIHEFVFNKEITEEEFIEFCEMNNLKIKKPGAWYEEYSEIKNIYANNSVPSFMNNGVSTSWRYDWVKPFTD